MGPPLGVAPLWLRQEQRLEELCGAILRYRAVAKGIPDEWLEEVQELAKRLRARKGRKVRHETFA